MNAFIAFLRRLGLGGIIVLILSYVLRGGPPGGAVKIYLFASIGVYIVAVILTWISSNHAIEMASGILGEELPAKRPSGVLDTFTIY